MNGWTKTVYVQFPDEATARAAALQLGAIFPDDGSLPTGDENYALKAPIVEWLTPPSYTVDGDGNSVLVAAGEVRPGYWAMMRFNLDTVLGAATYAQVQTMGVIQTLDAPGNVFAE